MASAQSNAIAFCRVRIVAFVDLVWSFLNKPHLSAQSSLNGDAHKPVDQLKGLWTAVAAFAPRETSDAHREPYSAN